MLPAVNSNNRDRYYKKTTCQWFPMNFAVFFIFFTEHREAISIKIEQIIMNKKNEEAKTTTDDNKTTYSFALMNVMIMCQSNNNFRL